MSYTVLQCPVLTAKERPHRRFSQPMKALFKLFRRFDARRIFGFIRRLGGMSRPKVKCYDLRSTHALRVEGDFRGIGCRQTPTRHFYPRPPGGGRPIPVVFLDMIAEFLSTPSGWRATITGIITGACDLIISIHALRVEGDSKNGQSFRLFLRKREKNLPL